MKVTFDYFASNLLLSFFFNFKKFINAYDLNHNHGYNKL